MDFCFTAKDVHWIYHPSTGAIPFIFNKDKTKIKQLTDNKIIELTEKHAHVNPNTSAKNAFSERYQLDMSYVNLTAIFAHVNALQNLHHFGLQYLDAETKLNLDQIKFLSENYAKKIAKTHKKEQAEKEKQQKQEKEQEKMFDF